MKTPNVIPGLVFTGINGAFAGRVQVLKVNHDTKKIIVHLTLCQDGDTIKSCKHTDWTEEWNFFHVLWALERGDYFEKTDWPDYPPLQTIETSIP